MKGHLQKGEIGTIIAISALVIIGVSSLVSSVFLSQKQITSSKAEGNCTRVKKCKECQGPNKECKPIPNTVGQEFQCCQTQTTAPTAIPVPTVKDECTDGQTSNQGCGVYTCAVDRSRQCKCITDKKTNSLKWSCLCVPDASCNPPTATPISTPAPTAVPASTGLGAGSENPTETGGSSAYCPDGGIPDTGFAAGACDYGKESAGNTTYYIDQNNPQCSSCIWTNYSGGFPYGQCHYANSSVCRRSDNVGGCAGVCNAACCSGNSPKKDGEIYDQGNPPESSGITSSDTGAGGEEFTVAEDMIFSDTPICGDDGHNYIVYPDGFILDIGPCS